MNGEALTLEDLRLGIQLIWTSDVQQVGEGTGLDPGKLYTVI